MKFLLDQNLSPRIVARLQDIYPGSSHVYLLDLHQAPDLVIWNYARQYEFTLVTRDVDFSELSILRGFPPKIIWIRRGNCSTSEVEAIFRLHREDINLLDNDSALGMIELF